MKTIKLGKKIIEMYDTISDLPIDRFNMYNKFMLVMAGVGADLTNADNHIERAMRFNASGDTENANKELENLRQCLYLTEKQINPKHLAFAVLIKSINGVERTNITDAGLQRTLEQINTISESRLTKILNAVKKKLILN